MTLEKAQVIRKLLNELDELRRELCRYEECTSIVGTISLDNGKNVSPIRWAQTDRQVKYLIEGVKKDICRVEKTIAEFEEAEKDPLQHAYML